MVTPRGISSADLGDWGRDEQPERIGPYEITGVLGKGGMGVVFDAVDQMRRRVALKVIRPQGDPENAQLLTARFLREAKILEELDHPSVVRLVDSGDVDGILYLAMERIEGVSLLTIRRRGALGFDPLVQLGIQLADALAHMHEAGIVHRDIKPANILIDAKGQPIITDFGISGMSEATGITRMGDLLGSPGFMAPEVTEGHPPSPQSDQFALGRLLYELGASGPAKKLPKNAPILEILSASLEIDWNRFPKNDRWTTLASILRRTVATYPSERYPSCRSVKSALQALTSADLLDSETLSEHVHNLRLTPGPAFGEMSDWPPKELGEALAFDLKEPRDEPFAEETTIDAEDVTMPPQSFKAALPLRSSPFNPPLIQTSPPPLPAPPPTLSDEGPTRPDPAALEDSIPAMPASPRAMSVPRVLPDLTASEQHLETPREMIEPTLANEPPPVSPTAVTLQDMPLFELAKQPQPQQVQVVDIEDLQLVRLERQIARLKEQLAQSRKEAARPQPASAWPKVMIGATVALAVGLVVGTYASHLLRADEAPLVIVPAYGPDTGGPKVTYRGQTPTSDVLTTGRAEFTGALDHMKAGDYGAAEMLLESCIESADLPECHKTLGTLLALRGHPAARAHFEHYLTVSPNAPDADSIRRMLAKP